jgi:dTDP-4-amino-4,6-dideoxygalactose transaminase
MPMHTPLSYAALRSAATDMLPWRDDARPRLAALLAGLYDADDVLLLDCGTHALELALRLAMRYVGAQGAPTTVALPAYTCFDVATAAVGAGAKVALYDMDPRTLAPDLDSVEQVMVSGARIVVVAPLYGIPVDWDAIEACAMRHHAVVIEDAAQGYGSSWHGRPVGALGRLSVLSFGRGKGWTGGGGGALLARRGMIEALGPLNEFAPRAAPSFAGFLAATAQWTFGRPSLYGIPASLPWLHLGETRYRQPALSSGASRAAAGVIERSLALAACEVPRRQSNARALIAQIAGLASSHAANGIRAVRPPVESVPGYLRLPILLRGGGTALPDLRKAARLGICPGYPATLGSLAAIRQRMERGAGTKWPGADELVRDLVTLPTHSLVTSREREEQVLLLCGGRTQPG